MNEPMTPEQKTAALIKAIKKADRKLDWILEPGARTPGRKSNAARTPSEWAVTTATHVRRILRQALKKVKDKETVNHVDR